MGLHSNMDSNHLRTYPIKPLVVFLSICFLVSIGMIVLMVFLTDEMWVIRIMTWVVCGIFTIASGIVLVYQLFYYVEVKDDFFIKHVFLGYQRVPLKRIDKLVNNNGFYDIIVKGRKICSFATNTKEAQEIIVYLEKRGVKIDW